jgi:DNA-binding PadR family transcriptional regulator
MKDMKYGARHHDDFGDHGHGPRGRRGGFGPPFGPPFGPGFGPGPRKGPRGGRARGDVRVAILVLLAEQPRHGYDLMRAIEERSGGMWSPSPGSIYPTLQSLEDEGFVTFETVDGRKTASVTEAGREWLEAHNAEAQAVFAEQEDASKSMALRHEMHQLRDAIMLAARQGDDTAEAAAAILAKARKDLYALLSA